MKRQALSWAVPVLAAVTVLALTATLTMAAPTSRSRGSSTGTSYAAPVYVAPGVYPAGAPGIGGAFYYAPGASGDTTAVINVKVPAGAEVWFNDYQTKLTGTTRTFVSPPLQPSLSYRYHVQVRWLENGQAVVQERDVPVAPGIETTVQFSGLDSATTR